MVTLCHFTFMKLLTLFDSLQIISFFIFIFLTYLQTLIWFSLLVYRLFLLSTKFIRLFYKFLRFINFNMTLPIFIYITCQLSPLRLLTTFALSGHTWVGYRYPFEPFIYIDNLSTFLIFFWSNQLPLPMAIPSAISINIHMWWKKLRIGIIKTSWDDQKFDPNTRYKLARSRNQLSESAV